MVYWKTTYRKTTPPPVSTPLSLPVHLDPLPFLLLALLLLFHPWVRTDQMISRRGVKEQGAERRGDPFFSYLQNGRRNDWTRICVQPAAVKLVCKLAICICFCQSRLD